MTVAYAIASDGKVIPFDSLDQTIAYNGDGTVNYVQAIYEGVTYRQTYTYSAGKLTGISRWQKQ